MALYELLAELNYLHVAILKKSQIASSYFHAGKLLISYGLKPGLLLKWEPVLKITLMRKVHGSF
jgi:hypothetical protein